MSIEACVNKMVRQLSLALIEWPKSIIVEKNFWFVDYKQIWSRADSTKDELPGKMKEYNRIHPFNQYKLK